jgi:Calcineurin-like phosphoesterase
MRFRLSAFPILLGAGWLAVVAVPRTHGPAPAGHPAVGDSLNDGPHVYWQDSTHAIVFSLCGDAAPAVRYEARDTLIFAGQCGDSLVRYRVPVRPYPPARATWKGVPRFLAISDIHGEYDAMVDFLRRAGVVDSTGRWSWGDGHLVIVGDVVDRGAGVTECLWFLHRLEQEAERAGGHVHITLGNHEMMVMRDDLRYVNEKYTDGIVRSMGVRYQDLYGPEMELGRWLRSKPFALKINDVVFVHGGIAPQVVARGLGIDTLNAIGRANLDMSSVAFIFSDLPSLVLGSAGPLWYRGYLTARAGLYPATTPEEFDAVLKFYGASAIVVGHTDIGQVMRLREGRLFAIDVSLETLGTFQGLLWEKGTFSVVSGLGTILPLD